MAIITDHIERAKNRLLEQYKGLPKLEGTIEAIVQEWQVLENVLCDLQEKRLNIDLATGELLDLIGTIVVLNRDGRDDSTYRLALKAKIIQNVSQGEPESIINIVRLLMNTDLVHLQEFFPAGIFISGAGDIDPAEIDLFFENVQIATAAGVRVDFIGCFDDTEPFSFDGLLPGEGFGDTGDAVAGGKFGFLHQPTLPEFGFAGDDLRPSGFGTLEDTLVGGLFVSL